MIIASRTLEGSTFHALPLTSSDCESECPKLTWCWNHSSHIPVIFFLELCGKMMGKDTPTSQNTQTFPVKIWEHRFPLNPHTGDATFERMQVLNSVLSILCVLGESLLLNRMDHTVWQNYLLSLLSYCLIWQGKNSSALRMRKQELEEVSDGPEGFILPANKKKTNHNEMRMTTIFYRQKSMAPAKLNIFHVSLLSSPPVPL